MRIKPSNYCLVSFEQREFVDLQKLKQGILHQEEQEQILAVSLLVGKVVPLNDVELAAFRALRRDRWSSAAKLCRSIPDLGMAALRRMAAQGVLVTDSADPELAELRLRHEVLEAKGWNRYAALFHLMARWGDRCGEGGAYPETEVEWEEALTGGMLILRQYVEEHGPPPSPFHNRPDRTGRLELELPAHRSPFVELLSRRRTTRGYDARQPMSTAELSTVLYYVFGCHGLFEPVPEMTVLKKTSPSPGALHSIEAYPVVMNVDGVAPGLYHYNVANHALDLLRPMTHSAAQELAEVATGGQDFASRAGVLFFVTARFERMFWKYREVSKAYIALMLEAGHFGQTFYLVCADLGLGAIFNAAINDCNIDESLGIDGLNEGAIALMGCGRLSTDRSRLDPNFATYVPRRTNPTR